MIICRTPVRIDFGGGGTDVEPYASEQGGLVVNATINKYVRSLIGERHDKMLKLISNDLNKVLQVDSIGDLTFDTKIDLMAAVIKRFNPSKGLDVYVRSDVPPGSGLGTSASVSTSLVGALNKLLCGGMTKHGIVEVGFGAEHDDLGNEGGKQDQYAAVFGGFNVITFSKDGVTIRPLKVSEAFIKELTDHLVLYYTGRPHKSGNLVTKQVNAYKKDKEGSTITLDTIKELTKELIYAFEREDLETIAQLMNQELIIKTTFNPSIMTDDMWKLYYESKENGVIGGRVCGAGGGGCMILLTNDKEKTTEYLKTQEGEIIPFEFINEGLTVKET